MGAVAVDLSQTKTVSIDVLKQAAKESGLRYNPDGSEYSDNHFHLDMGLNSKEAEDYAKDGNVDKSYTPTDDDFVGDSNPPDTDFSENPEDYINKPKLFRKLIDGIMSNFKREIEIRNRIKELEKQQEKLEEQLKKNKHVKN